jgi:tryptophan synthase alpha chain
MAGTSNEWLRHVEAAANAGADAIEIGLPFSDPMMDGVVIQEAAKRSLDRGTTLASVVGELASVDVGVPLVVMTYYNVLLHGGLERSAAMLAQVNVRGAIVPDLPPEESSEWSSACAPHDLATIYLVAPSTPNERVAMVAQRTQGFCYAQGRMAVTGTTSEEGDGASVAAAIRAVSDVPVYVGIGVSTPEQAQRAASYSDGVIVGSALVRRILDGATPNDVEDFVRSFRRALDASHE